MSLRAPQGLRNLPITRYEPSLLLPVPILSLRGPQGRGNLPTICSETISLIPADSCHCETSSQTGRGNPFSLAPPPGEPML